MKPAPDTHQKRRAAIYAAYDTQDFDKADLLYLKALRKVAGTIVFAMDNECSPEKTQWLTEHGYCDYVIAGRHGEYDFGSYKRGWFLLRERGIIGRLDELIMCNDSCYAPITPFEEMFRKMQFSDCNYWGIVGNRQHSYHIQSFFLVFRPPVFTSAPFSKFMSSIEAQDSVWDVIMKYEIGLSTLLRDNGFTSDAYIQYPRDDKYPVSSFGSEINLTAFPIWLIKQGCPLIKKKAFRLQGDNMEGGDEALHEMMQRMGNISPEELGINVSLTHTIKALQAKKENLTKKILHFFYQKKVNKGKRVIYLFRIPFWKRKYIPRNMRKRPK